MKAARVVGALVGAALLLVPATAHATASAVSGATGVSFTGSHDTGVRERVELSGAGGAWVGRPSQGPVRLLSIRVFRAEPGHLILRELAHSGGARSFLLTAPDAVASRIERATLFLESVSPVVPLWAWRDGRWVKHLPVPLRASLDADGPAADLVAYVTKGVGLFCLTPDGNAPLAVASTQEGPTPHRLLGGSSRRALLPVAAAALVLAAGCLTSRLLHARGRECR